MSEEHYLKQELDTQVQHDLALFDALLSQALDGVWYWDLTDPDHQWISPQFWSMLGYNPRDKKHLASEWQALVADNDLQISKANFEKHLEDRSHPYDQVMRYRRKDGSLCFVRCRGFTLNDADGKATRMLAIHTDVTPIVGAVDEESAEKEVRDINSRLLETVRVDALTGLMNRDTVLYQTKRHIDAADKRLTPVSIALINLNNFKQVNALQGYDKGSAVLKEVAAALADTLRESDYLGRMEGNEFLLLMPDTFSADALIAAERMRSLIADRRFIHGESLTCSIGITTYNPIEQTKADSDASNSFNALQRLLKEAYTALGHAKVKADSCYRIIH